jgi:hypothetical protein
MDDPNRQRRNPQNVPPIHAASNTRYSIQDPSQQRRSVAGSSADGYRSAAPAPLTTSPTTARSMGTGTYGGYYQEPGTAFSGAMPQTAIQYGSDYTPDRQAQSFGGYNTAAMMYNVPQAGTQSSVYDTTQQFASRQPAALGMLNTTVAAAPYFSNETPESATGASALQQQAQPSTTSAAVYQQNQLQSYPASMSTVGAIPQSTESQDVPMENTDYMGTGLEEKWVEYQSALRVVFQNVRNGVLETASESLLNVSNWLLSQVADLGRSQQSNTWVNNPGLWTYLLTVNFRAEPG